MGLYSPSRAIERLCAATCKEGASDASILHRSKLLAPGLAALLTAGWPLDDVTTLCRTMAKGFVSVIKFNNPKNWAEYLSSVTCLNGLVRLVLPVDPALALETAELWMQGAEEAISSALSPLQVCKD